MDTRPLAARAATPTLAQAAARRFAHPMNGDIIHAAAEIPAHIRAKLDSPEAKAAALFRFPQPDPALLRAIESPIGRMLAAAKPPKQLPALGSLPEYSGEK